MAEPASGPQRSRPPSVTSGKVEREKRKRSRVTPEQLVHLERFFSLDRSPTAARRKEISDMLGMQERQTQIWFQNRRAKAKLQDGKKGSGSSVETPPDVPPLLVTGYEAELHNLLHEDEPVTIIHCTDLSVGTWRRIATTPGKHDLVAYLSDTKRCLTWFIHSSGYGFKMEIPFDIIVNTEFTNAAPGSGLASFFLSQPPTFYLESPSVSNPGRGTEQGRHWKKCADWTEDQQATKILKHDLVGSAVQLTHALHHINSHMSGLDVRLHSPSYSPQEPSTSVLETQPAAAFASTGYHYPPQDIVDLRQPDHPQPPSLHDESLHLPIERPSSGMTPEPPIYSQYPRHPSIGVDESASYAGHSETLLPHHISHSSIPAHCESSRAHTPLGSRQRSSVCSLSYENANRIVPFPDNLESIKNGAPTPFETSSPPLLTTPFYPAGSDPRRYGVGPYAYDPAVPVISGMPGLLQ